MSEHELEEVTRVPVMALAVIYYQFKEHRIGDRILKAHEEVELKYLTIEHLSQYDEMISWDSDLDYLVKSSFASFPPRQNIKRIFGWCKKCSGQIELGFEVDGVDYDESMLNRVEDWSEEFKKVHSMRLKPEE